MGWTTAQGADAFIHEPSQWEDFDGDGYGDNFDGVDVDYCQEVPGTSFEDRFGCPDTDYDGWSDPDAFWTIAKWETLGYGPDYFTIDSTQWYDSDEDGFGDNWGDPSWNATRNETWPGIWIEGAIGDMCPLEVNDGLYGNDNSRPGCPVEEENSGNNKNSGDGSSSQNGIETVTLIGIISGIVVLLLVVAVVVLSKGSKKSQKKTKKTPISVALEGPEPPAPHPAIEPATEEDPSEIEEEEKPAEEIEMVSSWEDLPVGEYLEPDADGRVWFKDENGEHWFQNSDESWSKWKE